MRKIIPAFLALTMLCSANSAQAWKITITGTGPAPQVETQTDITPPNPPLPPPVVIPPVTDNTPFSFPTYQPPQENNGEARYYNLCPLLGGCYAGLPFYNNPSRISHLFACYLPMGMTMNFASLGGLALYVPATLESSKIRTLCAGGSL